MRWVKGWKAEGLHACVAAWVRRSAEEGGFEKTTETLSGEFRGGEEWRALGRGTAWVCSLMGRDEKIIALLRASFRTQASLSYLITLWRGHGYEEVAASLFLGMLWCGQRNPKAVASLSTFLQPCAYREASSA